MNASKDVLARRLAAVALSLSLVAVMLGAYAVHLGQRYLDEVQELGQTLRSERPNSAAAAGSLGPPPTLDLEVD